MHTGGEHFYLLRQPHSPPLCLRCPPMVQKILLDWTAEGRKPLLCREWHEEVSFYLFCFSFFLEAPSPRACRAGERLRNQRLSHAGERLRGQRLGLGFVPETEFRPPPMARFSGNPQLLIQHKLTQ